MFFSFSGKITRNKTHFFYNDTEIVLYRHRPGIVVAVLTVDFNFTPDNMLFHLIKNMLNIKDL